MNEKSGGQAFPVSGDQESVRVLGMTLRDYFAAQALHGLMNIHSDVKTIFWKEAARQCYLAADAMLIERAK